jgi:para-aminobenzoate synthetase / 4-amino-4-deoxychorismate lyase
MLIFNFNKSFSASAPPLVFGAAERIITAYHVDEIQPALDEIASASRAGKYAAGFLSYEAAAAFDSALKTKSRRTDEDFPLLWFGIFDPASVSNTPPVAGLELYNVARCVDEWQPDITPEQYTESIKKIRAGILEGDIYQANYTLRLHSQFSGCAHAWYEDLRRDSHGRFNAFVDIGSHRILSMSPELFFSWDGHTLRTRPMKGTAKRSQPPAVESVNWQRWYDADERLAASLLESTKNRAENLMIVDLLRNDVSRVAKPGSVTVPHLFTLESYPTLYQMTSTITAETREGTTIADIFSALFPCGSITGAPKIKSSEVIAQLETTPRGVYCGALGYISPDGTSVFNVAIRTIVIDAATGATECGVGGGIVWDSEARDEYAEALAKAAFMQNAPHGFELLETLRLENGEYAFVDRHLERLLASADALGFDVQKKNIREALREHAHAHMNETRRVRLLVTRLGDITMTSETLDTTAPAWTKPRTGAPIKAKMPETAIPERGFNSAPPVRKVALANTPVDRHERALHHKTTRRTVYDTHRQQHPEAFDVLLWNRQRELTEFTYGSLVLEIDGVWLTPKLSAGLLPGVMRAELMARGEMVERVLTLDDLARAQSMWFINSVRGWIHVELDMHEK